MFESIDPKAFSFLACDVQGPDGVRDDPRYWLCDVLRILDALDGDLSRLKVGICDHPVHRDFGQKFYEFPEATELIFKKELVGDAHVFRMAYQRISIIGDGVLNNACNSAGIRGILLQDVSSL